MLVILYMISRCISVPTRFALNRLGIQPVESAMRLPHFWRMPNCRAETELADALCRAIAYLVSFDETAYMQEVHEAALGHGHAIRGERCADPWVPAHENTADCERLSRLNLP